MSGFISRGAPAKYAHHGIIEKQKTDSNRISCSKCIYYVDKDKSCSKKKLFIPTAGYDRWKYCNRFRLISDLNNAKNRSYVHKIQTITAEKAKKTKVSLSAPSKLKLKNLMSGKIEEFQVSSKKKGPNILHPSDALVIKAKQTPKGKGFYWNGKTYKVIK